jgi:hypothetical protein
MVLLAVENPEVLDPNNLAFLMDFVEMATASPELEVRGPISTATFTFLFFNL